MLPTSGYFMSVTCPFFVNGLCERPHCHFRHVNTAQSSMQPKASVLEAEASRSVDSKPDLLLLVREAILQVQKEVEADKSEELPSNGLIAATHHSTAGICTSDLEPVKTNSIAFENTIGCPQMLVQPQLDPVNIAEYKPTPISQLKKLQLQNKVCSEYAPTSKANSKILYVPESKSGTIDPISYIPNPIDKKSRNKTPTRDVNIDVSMKVVVVDDVQDEITTNERTNVICDESSNKTSEECDSDKTTTGFDLVNKILLESSSCDSLISAASARRISDVQKSKHDSFEAVSLRSPGSARAICNKKLSKKSSDMKVSKGGVCKSYKLKTFSVKVEEATEISEDTKSGSLQKDVNKVPLVAKQNIINLKRKLKVNDSDKNNFPVKKEGNKDTTVKTKSNRTVVSPKKVLIGTKKKKLSQNSCDEKKPSGIDGSVNNKCDQNDTVKGITKTTETNLVPKASISCLSPIKSRAEFQQTRTEELFDIIDIDDSDIEDDINVDEECLKIFNEYVPQTNSSVSTSNKVKEAPVSEDTDVVIPSKLRVAHTCSSGRDSIHRAVPVAKYKPSPSQVMYERFLRVQQMVLENRDKNNVDEPVQSSSKRLPSNCLAEVAGKQRIAHGHNGKSSLQANYPPSSPKSRTMVPSSSRIAENTTAHTNEKGNLRVAHHPKVSLFVRPTIPAEYGSKVPTNIRQRHLNFIINECVKIYGCEQDACDRGLSEEKSAYDRSANRAVYLNVVANTIKKLRNELPNSSKTTTSSCNTVSQRVTSHEFNLGGKKAANVSYSIERIKNKCNDTDLSGVHLYKALKKYILTEEQLVENGFPFPHPTEPGVTVILKPNVKRNNSTEKVCCRCGTTFTVTESGVFVTKDECFYHWGRAHKVRTCGGLETRYSCCQAGLHSEGCCVGKLHVYDDVDPFNLKGFVKTLPKSPPADGNYEVFALDCEMCYTNMGNELTRITVVDSNSKPVFESLVKPDNQIIDYNTRFSGITESNLKDVETTLRDIQAIILNKFSDKTILIGHSLESDFKALKIIHKTVVDTSLVFPHKMGLPYKRALRSLVAEYLKKIIQNGVNGHDSQEDAASCIQLMQWKTKEDMKMVY